MFFSVFFIDVLILFDGLTNLCLDNWARELNNTSSEISIIFEQCLMYNSCFITSGIKDILVTIH